MDKYIDYGEVSEYGRGFVQAVAQLIGLSQFVDVAKLGAMVAGKVDAVDSEMQKARNERSDLRNERGGTEHAEEAVRDAVTRFYYHLRSLPKSTSFDFEAFFPGRVIGELSGLKPADLQGKAADVLRGFDTPNNKVIANFASWKADLTLAHQTLTDALAGKSKATGNAFIATAGLIQARKDFLYAYNKIAKPIVRGVLNELGRDHEMPHFFRDLAVNEGGREAPDRTSETG